MRVAELIERLSAMPLDASVTLLWDGAARSDVEAVWLSAGGDDLGWRDRVEPYVVLAPLHEPVYSEYDRIAGAPPYGYAPENKGHVWEMLGLPEPKEESDG